MKVSGRSVPDRTGDGALRVRQPRPLCRSPDHCRRPVLWREVDDRGRQALAFAIGQQDWKAAIDDPHQGVRRAEVNTDNLAHLFNLQFLRG